MLIYENPQDYRCRKRKRISMRKSGGNRSSSSDIFSPKDESVYTAGLRLVEDLQDTVNNMSCYPGVYQHLSLVDTAAELIADSSSHPDLAYLPSIGAVGIKFDLNDELTNAIVPPNQPSILLPSDSGTFGIVYVHAYPDGRMILRPGYFSGTYDSGTNTYEFTANFGSDSNSNKQHWSLQYYYDDISTWCEVKFLPVDGVVSSGKFPDIDLSRSIAHAATSLEYVNFLYEALRSTLDGTATAASISALANLYDGDVVNRANEAIQRAIASANDVKNATPAAVIAYIADLYKRTQLIQTDSSGSVEGFAYDYDIICNISSFSAQIFAQVGQIIGSILTIIGGVVTRVVGILTTLVSSLVAGFQKIEGALPTVVLNSSSDRYNAPCLSGEYGTDIDGLAYYDWYSGTNSPVMQYVNPFVQCEFRYPNNNSIQTGHDVTVFARCPLSIEDAYDIITYIYGQDPRTHSGKQFWAGGAGFLTWGSYQHNWDDCYSYYRLKIDGASNKLRIATDRAMYDTNEWLHCVWLNEWIDWLMMHTGESNQWSDTWGFRPLYGESIDADYNTMKWYIGNYLPWWCGNELTTIANIPTPDWSDTLYNSTFQENSRTSWVNALNCFFEMEDYLLSDGYEIPDSIGAVGGLNPYDYHIAPPTVNSCVVSQFNTLLCLTAAAVIAVSLFMKSRVTRAYRTAMSKWACRLEKKTNDARANYSRATASNTPAALKTYYKDLANQQYRSLQSEVGYYNAITNIFGGSNFSIIDSDFFTESKGIYNLNSNLLESRVKLPEMSNTLDLADMIDDTDVDLSGIEDSMSRIESLIK